MATLLLTAVGTAIAGPVGGALGALAGQQVDGAIFGSGSREGPRLADLAVTTSSYGLPIARHFGTMRSAGTIIWSTDLVETKEKSGGGKGKPSTTSFSYSVSFAIALSSRPIAGLGRIWADGNLLRGSAGDLKAPGAMRLYLGVGDEMVDPLIGSAEGSSAPAFRDMAYVVFEDLQLGDFGNRIPALTFEVFADTTSQISLGDIVPSVNIPADENATLELRGFSDRGGTLGATLSSIDRAIPIGAITNSRGLTLFRLDSVTDQPTLLPERLHLVGSDESEGNSPSVRRRLAASNPEPRALRYYDVTRDFQPSVQRAIGRSQGSREIIIELPAAIDPNAARAIIGTVARKSRWQADTLTWRTAELGDGLEPGQLVTIPDQPGIWRIATWEWLDRGVELFLERVTPRGTMPLAGDAGAVVPPQDSPLSPTQLRAIELPWDGTGASHDVSFFAAVSSSTPNWPGAALYLDSFGGLQPLDIYARERSTFGSLLNDLPPSHSLFFQPSAEFEITINGIGLDLRSTTIESLSNGANRMLVGQEVLQFLHAEELEPNRWRLAGLLRGRGGTEWAAAHGHIAGSEIVSIDDSLAKLPEGPISPTGSTSIAALGFSDEEPVFASLTSTGVSRQPLSPVHPQLTITADGVWKSCWTRRARGQYRWVDFVDVPLVEEAESYLVGLGPTDQPLVSWTTEEPVFSLSQTERTGLAAEHGNQPLWVAQTGTFGLSHPTFLGEIN